MFSLDQIKTILLNGNDKHLNIETKLVFLNKDIINLILLYLDDVNDIKKNMFQKMMFG